MVCVVELYEYCHESDMKDFSALTLYCTTSLQCVFSFYERDCRSRLHHQLYYFKCHANMIEQKITGIIFCWLLFIGCMVLDTKIYSEFA